MSLTLHEAAVPVFSRYLRQLSSMLARAQDHARRQGLHDSTLLQARLSPSMYPLATQVAIATGFVPRACAPLVGLAVPPYQPPEDSFAGLQARIGQALEFLAALPPGALDQGADARIESQAGERILSLDGREFLTQYALPNFFFHVTTAYAILRHLGVGLGKGDFDGFHVYDGP